MKILPARSWKQLIVVFAFASGDLADLLEMLQPTDLGFNNFTKKVMNYRKYNILAEGNKNYRKEYQLAETNISNNSKVVINQF